MASGPAALSPSELVLQIEAARQRLAGQLGDIDPGDLLLILQSILRPFGTGRRFLLRELAPGRHVP